MTNLIQGKDAVLSFYKNSFIPVVCSTDISLAITSDTVPTKTKGGGVWKSFNYQALSYEVSLSGLLKFDVANWTGWDMLDNQVNFSQVTFQITFSDDAGNIKSIRGTAVIKTNTTAINIGTLVKQDFVMTGSGSLLIFDGIVPCSAQIQTITVTGQLAADGTVHVAYTYTGTPYQIKYRVDGQGNYVYAAADFVIDIPGLDVGSHSIEIIPVCMNNYEGVGLAQPFVVTQAMTCGSVITNILISGGYIATNTHTGASTMMKYRIDGVFWLITNIDDPIDLSGVSLGTHIIEEVPICANDVEGTGFTKSFTVTVQPSQSEVDWAFTATTSGMLTIYKNGVLWVTQSVTGSGMFTVAVGDLIKAVVSSSHTNTRTLQVQDLTTSTILYNSSSAVDKQFIFTANGHTYSITGQTSF